MPAGSRYLAVAVSLCLLLALFAPLTAQASSQASSRTSTASNSAAFTDRYGIADSELAVNLSHMDKALQEIKNAGGRWVRVMFAWRDLEWLQNMWVFTLADLAVTKARQRGIKVLGIMGGAPVWANGGKMPNYPPISSHMDDWERYVRRLSSHYKGKVSAWEIWNEENISQFWAPKPNASRYVSLVSHTAPIIRAVDPKATIVMGGVAGLGTEYLHKCLNAGVAKYVDALAYHPYPENLGGGTKPYESLGRRAVRNVRSLISQHTSKHLGIWLTELGWTTKPGLLSRGVSETTQAYYMMRTFISYLETEVDRVILYNIYDGPISKCGILRTDMSRKLAAYYYRVFQKVFGPATSSAKKAAGYSCSRPSTLEAHAFHLPGGKLAMAVWKSDDSPDSVTLNLSSPAYGKPVIIDPATGAQGTAGNVSMTAAGCVSVKDLKVGKKPVILEFPRSASWEMSTWYLPEGTTNWGFDTYLSLENPNSSAVNAQITYMTNKGKVPGPAITIPALSQATIFPRDTLGATDFSTKVTSSAGKRIAVDRTMTWTGQGAASPEAHSSIGVTAPAQTWYLPEGSSSWGFECWLLIQNPTGSTATCRVTYMTEGEPPVEVRKSVPPNSRATFNMQDDIGQKDASIEVKSDVPVIPERSMYRNNRREGHDSIGTTAPALDYYLPEGTTAWGFTTYVLVQNPGDENAWVNVTYMTNNGPLQQPLFSMPPRSRKTIRVNDIFPSRDLSTQVHSDRPIIAERAMYWDNGTGEACHDSIGTRSAYYKFYLPDGQTSLGHETWTLVQNSNSTETVVEVSYLTETGEGNATFTDTVPANSRRTYFMADKVAASRAAVIVVSKTPGHKIIVERAMYWNSRGAGTDTIGCHSN